MILLGKNRGREVFLDPEKALNAQIVSVGKSGSGKSVANEMIALEIVKGGGTLIAFDHHQVLAADQIHPEIREIFNSYLNEIDVYTDGIRCPMFSPVTFPDGRLENSVDTIGAVADVFTRAYGLQCQQRAKLRSAVGYVYDNGSYAVEGIEALDAALAGMACEPANNVREKMYAILKHNVFRHGKLFIKPGKINILRLSNFDLETQAVLGEVILSYIWRLACSRSLDFGPLYVYADEAQNLTLRKSGALSQILSEGRKFNVNLLLATQSLSVGFSSTEQRRLMQTGLQLYFQPAANEINYIARMLDPARTSDWALTLRNLKVGECIAVGALCVEGKNIEVPIKISFKKE